MRRGRLPGIPSSSSLSPIPTNLTLRPSRPGTRHMEVTGGLTTRSLMSFVEGEEFRALPRLAHTHLTLTSDPGKRVRTRLENVI